MSTNSTGEVTFTVTPEQHTTIVAALALAAQQYANPRVVFDALNAVAPLAVAPLEEAVQR